MWIVVDRTKPFNNLIKTIKNSIEESTMKARRFTEARLVANLAYI